MPAFCFKNVVQKDALKPFPLFPSDEAKVNFSEEFYEGSRGVTASPETIERTDVDNTYDQYLFEEKQRISQDIISKIEKYSVLVFLMAFLTFNLVYWRDISLITSEISRKFGRNNFNHN